MNESIIGPVFIAIFIIVAIFISITLLKTDIKTSVYQTTKQEFKHELKEEINENTAEYKDEPLIVFEKFKKGVLFPEFFDGYFIKQGCDGGDDCYQGECDHIKRNGMVSAEVRRLGYVKVSESKIEPFSNCGMYSIYRNNEGKQLKEVVYCGV